MFSFFRRKVVDVAAAPQLPFVPDSECPWLDDDEDYRELPLLPEGVQFSDRAMSEFTRKWSVRNEATNLVDRDIEEEGMLNGQAVTRNQREVMIRRKARAIASARLMAEEAEDREIDRKHEERLEQLRHEQVIDAIESSTPYSAAKKFAKEHPILTGVLVGTAANKLRK